MEIDRRAFVYRASGLVAALAVSGCASVAVTRVPAAEGRVRLPLREYPALGGPEGYLRVQPEGVATPVYVLAMGEGEYAALSPICTHQGCTVGLEGELLVCPCHGSTYARTGEVLRGPAERPLLRFPVELTSDGVLVIDIRVPA